MEGARNNFRDARRVVDLDNPFREGPENRAVIHLLKGTAPECATLHLPDEKDQRNGIVFGNVNARRGIGRTGRTRHENNTGTPRKPGAGIGHHRRAAFLAADRDCELRIMKGVQHREIGLSRHAEDMTRALHGKLIDEDLRSGTAVIDHAAPPQSGSARISLVC